jgi:hemoglobin
MVSLRVAAAYTPTAEDPPIARLGGPDAVKLLVNRFYDAMEAAEPALTALHATEAPGKVSRSVREHFALFLVYWFGGDETYLSVRGHPRLRMRHAGFVVDASMRAAWLRSMKVALDQHAIEPSVRAYVDGRFEEVSAFLMNG